MDSHTGDQVDLKLIQELQKNGRESYVDLASRLNMVEGSIRKRVKRLLDQDIIKIVAVPNVTKLGYNFIVTMAMQVNVADLKEVAEKLAQKSNICYLAFVTGRYDLLAFVVVRSPEELSQFIQSEISSLPSILHTETFVNLDIIKGKWPFVDTSQLVDGIRSDSNVQKSRKRISKRR